MKYNNPIIPGMHADPSICRVGDDYYLVNSSFEFFPSIPIFHSQDLVNWEQIGHCVDKEENIKLRKGFPSGTGIYAPTIRYDGGKFYVISTNITYGELEKENFFVWTKDPLKGWSKPIYVDMPGIDPSFYFEDGHAYYTGAHNNQIIFCEIDLSNGERIGEAKYIWGGTGGNDPEGPHIYKKDGYYYLMISEGGTEYCHMITIARSKKIDGPYEAFENNPILSNRSRSTDIKATGHGDIVQAKDGSFYAVCLGIRCITYPYKHNLGRETMLMPVRWDEGEWPVLASNGILDVSYDIPSNMDTKWHETIKENELAGTNHYYDDFSSDKLNCSWNFIYNPLKDTFKPGSLDGKKGMLFYGNEIALKETKSLAWMGRRQEHHKCIAKTKLYFPCKEEGEEAGLTIYMNNAHHYEIALTILDGKKSIILRRQIGSLMAIENVIDVDFSEITLVLEADMEKYSFSFIAPDGSVTDIGNGECAYLTTEVGGRFTGNYIALYSTGNGKKCSTPALFEWYDYRADN